MFQENFNLAERKGAEDINQRDVDEALYFVKNQAGEDKNENIENANNKKIGRRGFLKTMAVVAGAVAVAGIAGSKAEASEEKESLIESMEGSDKDKLIANMRKCFFGNSSIKDVIDTGKEGILFSIGGGEIDKNEEDDLTLVSVKIPNEKVKRCNEKMGAFASKLQEASGKLNEELIKRGTEISKEEALELRDKDAIVAKKDLGNGEIKYYRVPSEVVQDKEFIKFVLATKKYIETIRDRAGEDLLDMGERFNSREVKIDDLRAGFESRISDNALKLKDGEYGYKKILKSGNIKYLKFTPIKDGK
jgi:hypothetical protein